MSRGLQLWGGWLSLGPAFPPLSLMHTALGVTNRLTKPCPSQLYAPHLSCSAPSSLLLPQREKPSIISGLIGGHFLLVFPKKWNFWKLGSRIVVKSLAICTNWQQGTGREGIWRLVEGGLVGSPQVWGSKIPAVSISSLSPVQRSPRVPLAASPDGPWVPTAQKGAVPYPKDWSWQAAGRQRPSTPPPPRLPRGLEP